MRTTLWVYPFMTASLVGLLSLSPALAAEPNEPPPGSPKDEAFDDVARKLFRDGNKAMDQQQWEQCRASFTAAWNIKKQYQIAGNLAVCEAKLGFYRDAAEHLRYFLREMPKDVSPERKKSGEVLFEEVRKKVALMAVFVNIAGAEVLVDGVSMGRSPLVEPFFVESGLHTVVAQFAGYPSAKYVVDAAMGSQHQITLELRAPSAEKRNVGQAGQPDIMKPPEPQPRPEMSRLPVRKIVIGSGIGISATMVGIGVGFVVASNQKASEADALRATIQKDGGINTCHTPGHAAACDNLLALGKDQSRFADVAAWSFIGGGLVAVGTVGYTLATRNKPQPRALQVLPTVGVGHIGAMVCGHW